MAKKTDGADWVAYTFKMPESLLNDCKEAAEQVKQTMSGEMLGFSAWLRMAMREKLERHRQSLVPAEPVDRKKGERR